MQSQKKTFRRNISLFIALLAMWLIMSGFYDFFHISLGVISIIFLLWFNRNISILPQSKIFYRPRFNKVGIIDASNQTSYEKVSRHLKIIKLMYYIPWLLFQIAVSAFHVAYVTMHPKMPISPSLFRFKSKQPHTFARVTLGNSITLTPGTLTIEVEDDSYLIHALTNSTRNGLLTGEMQKKVALLFVDKPEEMVFEVEENIKICN